MRPNSLGYTDDGAASDAQDRKLSIFHKAERKISSEHPPRFPDRTRLRICAIDSLSTDVGTS